MPRAIWSGAISFGLVNIPVKLYSAVSRKTVRFHQIDAKSGARIQQKRVSPADGEEVAVRAHRQGLRDQPRPYVMITPEELDALEPQKTRTIDIEDFVDLEQIDPIYYDHPYYLVPDTGAEKAYKLLVDAMEDAGQGRDRARGDPLEGEPGGHPRRATACSPMETMLFADEVVAARHARRAAPPTKTEDQQARARHGDAADRVAVLATSTRTSTSDEYRERVLEHDRAQGGRARTIAIEQPEPRSRRRCPT